MFSSCKRLVAPLRFVCLFTLALLFAPQAWSQARVDPNLPPEPLFHHRTFLIFPGYETVHPIEGRVPKITVGQKFEIAYRKTFDPSIVPQAAIFAAASQTGYYGPQYGPGAGPYLERFGYYAGNLAASNLFSDAVVPSVFHQDPRYFRKGRGSVAGRTWWALRSEFVTESDRGNQTFNISKALGYGMATALSSAYSPGGPQSPAGFSESYGIKFGVNFVANLFREFGAPTTPPEEH